MKNRTVKIMILVLGLAVGCFSPGFSLNSQEQERVASLVKEIRQAKDSAGLSAFFEELQGIYCKNNQFEDLVSTLESLDGQDKSLGLFVDYYVADTRYRKLKYLEENQKWEEYFARDKTYRNEIAESLNKVIGATQPADALHLVSRLLLWKFYRGQQDPLAEAQLTDFMNEMAQYSKGGLVDAALIKNAAEALSFYNEKSKSAQLYKMYVEKLVAASKDNAQLKNAARALYDQGNLELSEVIYDFYITKIVAEQGKAALAVLIDIARQFCYRDREPNDPAYAEKIFVKIEELGGKAAFNEELMYLRAYNLEKLKEFTLAKDRYLDLINAFPKTPHRDEAEYKIGIIFTYALRDLNTGRNYFTRLLEKQNISPETIASIYQLGLLAQWEGKFDEARKYYLVLKDKIKDGFLENANLTDERLKELNENRLLEYNLRTFLDVSIKPENTQFDRTKVDLRIHSYRSVKDEQVDITTSYHYGDNGCLEPQLQYLWSGDLGTYQSFSQNLTAESSALAKTDASLTSFSTKYGQAGTKVINLVVVSSTGVIERNFDMADVLTEAAR